MFARGTTRVALGVAVALSLAVAGCRGGGDDDESKEQDDSDDSDSESSGFGFPGGAFAMASLLENAKKPGLYDEPKKSKEFDEDEAHFAVLELDGPVVELETVNFLGGTTGAELYPILQKLRELSTSEKVSGLILRLGSVSMAPATVEDLHAGLIAFKGSGDARKSLHCHADNAENLGYLLLTACDDIALAPTGMISITGAGATPLHLKGLLDKLGVQADFVHVGAFKGAAEPLTRNEPSPEMKETLGAIIDEHYETLVSGIATHRDLDREKVVALIDTAIFTDSAAREASLIDQIATFEDYRADVIGDQEWTRVSLEKEGAEGFGDLMQLLGLKPAERPSVDHVALVYAVGNIIDGEGEGKLGARNEISARTLTAALRALAAADSVKAVVLRVDSGGGSAAASELIWRAAGELSQKKPVIVSMGSVAASGGYYISAGAKKIYAQRTTLTGSIGVVGGKLAVGKALSRWGIDTYQMGRGKRAHLWSGVSPWTGEEREEIRSLMRAVYDVFLKRVAEGRGKSVDEIEPIAQGRVWTGAKAVELGLVDEIGGLEAALADARKLAGVDADAPLEVYPPDPTLMDFLSAYGLGVRAPAGVDADLVNAALATAATYLGPESAMAVRSTLMQLAELERSPIQAALIWPLATP